LIEIINKQLLLQLVGYLCYWQMGFNSVFKGLSNYCTHAQSAAVGHDAFRLRRPVFPTFDVRLPLSTAPLRTTAAGGTKLRNRVNYFGLYSGKTLACFASS